MVVHVGDVGIPGGVGCDSARAVIAGVSSCAFLCSRTGKSRSSANCAIRSDLSKQAICRIRDIDISFRSDAYSERRVEGGDVPRSILTAEELPRTGEGCDYSIWRNLT